LHATLKDTAAYSAILGVLEQGGVVAGCSAGAMIWGEVIPSFPTMIPLKPAFNKLPHSITLPHYDEFGERWAGLRALREAVTETIEPLRRDKTVRSSLEAEVEVPVAMVPEGFTDEALAELFITASVTRTDGESVSAKRTSEDKCGRCWRLLPDVAEDGALCGRCETVVAGQEAAA